MNERNATLNDIYAVWKSICPKLQRSDDQDQCSQLINVRRGANIRVRNVLERDLTEPQDDSRLFLLLHLIRPS
jgi:hypothetical protein